MKMAKASERDIEAAMELMGVLNTVDGGYYPSMDDDAEGDPTFFDEEDKAHLAVFYSRIKACMDRSPGFIGRVVGGMHTILHNDILDPNDDCLALHPRLLAAQPA
jgi:hypothetical protein